MEEIRHQVNSFLKDDPTIARRSVAKIRQDKGLLIKSYRELVERVAEVAFSNPEFVLLFRGQTKDYREAKKTTLFPSLFRKKFVGNGMFSYRLRERYEKLRAKEEGLIRAFGGKYRSRISRSQILRWAIIQHYELCPTPLIDLTHSLLVAASFALAGVSDSTKEVFLFALGMPQISGAITVISEHSMQIVRLSSVCPPTTLRPYFQEGYLAGTFPLLDTLNQKMEYPRSEVDCAKRLVAKFRLRMGGFWNGFSPLDDEALYPDESHLFNKRILNLRDDN